MQTSPLEEICMAWLDRDRTPVLFAVSTSVTSGLISFVVANVVLSGIPKGVLLLGALGVLCVVGLGTWVVMSVRRARKEPKRAFVIVSAFEEQYYVASFVQQLHNALDRVGIDLVLKAPARDHDAHAQSHLLQRVLDRRHEYMGGVIVAGDVRHLRDDLRLFCQNLKLPVVFTDLEPFEESEYPGNSVYVGYDTAQLGALAGSWLARHLRAVEHPRVLIIASHEHSERQRECVRVLQDELVGVSIEIDDSCEFDRSRAHDAVAKHVRGLGPDDCLHAVFCTDDETGLAAVVALATPSPATGSTVVVGIDGVGEARALIDSGTSRFRATVVQNTHQLALGIADRLVKLADGRQPPRRTILKGSIHEATR